MSHSLSLGLAWSQNDDSIRSMASHMDRALQKINSSQAWSILWIQILADQIQDRARGELYEKLFLKDSPDIHFIKMLCLLQEPDIIGACTTCYCSSSRM